MYNFRSVVLTATIYFGLAISPVFATPILNIDVNGQLTGATGIDINGSLFDVEFLKGTCSGLFAGCDESSDFFWTTQSEAIDASNALGNQIFNSLNPIFNSSPELIYGCSSTLVCDIRSLYGFAFGSPNLTAAYNYSVRGGENLVQPWLFERVTEIASPIVSYAWWSAATVKPGPNPVPAPQTLGLFLLGVFGLVINRNKKPNIQEK